MSAEGWHCSSSVWEEKILTSLLTSEPGSLLLLMNQVLRAGCEGELVVNAVQGHMTETLKTFVGARLAVDKDRSDAVSDLSAEDDALVSLLAGAGISDPSGRAHFAQALREHLLASQRTGSVSQASTATDDSASEADSGTTGDGSSPTNLQDGKDDQLEGVEQNVELAETRRAHGITSHGHRAFLIDDSNPATASAHKKSDHNSEPV